MDGLKKMIPFLYGGWLNKNSGGYYQNFQGVPLSNKALEAGISGAETLEVAHRYWFP